MRLTRKLDTLFQEEKSEKETEKFSKKCWTFRKNFGMLRLSPIRLNFQERHIARKEKKDYENNRNE